MKKKLESKVCKYFENCNVAKITKRNCADYQNCQTYKFYEKYGEDYLGVGAMMTIPKYLKNENTKRRIK